MQGTGLDLHLGLDQGLDQRLVDLDQGLGLHLEVVDLGVDLGLEGVDLGLEGVDLGLEGVDLGLEGVDLGLEGVDLGLEGVDLGLEERHPLLHLYQLLLNLLDLSSLNVQSLKIYNAYPTSMTAYSESLQQI